MCHVDETRARASLSTVVALSLLSASCGGEDPLARLGGSDSEPLAATATDDDQHRYPEAPVVSDKLALAQSTAKLIEEGTLDAPLGPPYPVVLVHGFSGFDDLGPLEYFFGVVEALRDDGIDVYAPTQPPYTSTPERAEVLADHVDQILGHTGKAKVHLICHSQGGLDCRYLVAKLGFAEKVASVTSYATPHRGTPLAELALGAPDGTVNGAGRFLGWLLGFADGPRSVGGGVGTQRRDVCELGARHGGLR